MHKAFQAIDQAGGKWIEFADNNPIVLIAMVAFVAVLFVIQRQRLRAAAVATPGAIPTAAGWDAANVAATPVLDQVLLTWQPGDDLTVRGLLNGGVVIMGSSGTGKTSGGGQTLMRSIVTNPNSGGLILGAKPGDVGDVQRIFRDCKRITDLAIFGQDTKLRTNFLRSLSSPRDVVQFILTMSEAMKHRDSRSGGEGNRFYDAQEERCIYNAVAALQAAEEPLTFSNIHEFIMTAATSPQQLQDPAWREKYHSQVLERGFAAKKSVMEASDFKLLVDFFAKEWATMLDPKIRGNILAGVQGTLHVLNTGLVREMTSSNRPNCSPADILKGKWLLVNHPPSQGAGNLLIEVGWKHVMQLAILERHADENSPFVTIWGDEYHSIVTSHDAAYIAQCRSHKGCLVALTQSVSSFYAAMKGETGKHQADALLANFSHAIIHACDPVTAKWATAKLGRKKEVMYGGSSQGRDLTAWDEMFGNPAVNVNFNTHYEQVIQDQEFMVGRTGGAMNNYMVDAIVLKSGEPFCNGKNFLRRAFSQKW